MNGKKHDKGKAPLYRGLMLYFPDALEAVAQVSAYGANKYQVEFHEQNWRYVDGAEGRYEDALVRHTVRRVQEGLYDKESGLSHAAHRAWNALATLQFEIENMRGGVLRDADIINDNIYNGFNGMSAKDFAVGGTD